MTNFSDYLGNIKEQIEASSDEARQEAVSEGISNMKSKIGDLKLDGDRKANLGKWSEGIKRAPKAIDKNELADRAIDTYKNKVLPKKEVEAGVEHPTEGPKVFTKAQQDNIVAAARTLAGQRNSGNEGKTSPTGENGGNLGKMSPSGQNGGNYGSFAGNPAFSAGVGPTNLTIGEEKKESLEEYQARIYESFGLVEGVLDAALETDKKVGELHKKVEKDVKRMKDGKKFKEEVVALVDALNLLEDCSWQQVDKTTREVALEFGITLKELNKAFREEFGQYPDKWITEQVIAEECGMMPLSEVARVVATGLLYDVTMMWRGKTMRMQFFYPEAGLPTRKQMQSAVEKFYPSARLISYYPSRDQDAGSFIMVPPMSESYVVLEQSDWVELSEEAALSYEIICEEVGEPVFCPYEISEGNYGVLVSDHDTGEEITVTFGEGVLDMFKDKRSDAEKKHAKLTKMASELDRLQRQAKDKHADDSKAAAEAARSPRKAPATKKVYARKVSEKKPVVAEQSSVVTLKDLELRQYMARRDAFVNSIL